MISGGLKETRIKYNLDKLKRIAKNKVFFFSHKIRGFPNRYLIVVGSAKKQEQMQIKEKTKDGCANRPSKRSLIRKKSQAKSHRSPAAE